MKIKFNPNLDFQNRAIDSITGIFKGQEVSNTRFTVSALQQGDLYESDIGVGNRLKLLEEDILSNVQSIQIQNGLRRDNTLESMDFSIEMETGTGKTYVYLRTLLELNEKYGFSKFVIVVPSIAIREGVYKSLQMTEEHFSELHNNVPYDYFIYNSDDLNKVRSFATSQNIQIMIINIQAFRRSFTNPDAEKKANIIHRPHDLMSGQKPIEFIQSTNPVVIIDEPQSVATTNKSQEAISSLNPLCTLRYSATHVDDYHMMYKLDSVDAYEKKLVKQIEVASIQVQDAQNKAFFEVHDVKTKSGDPIAKISFDQFKNGKTRRVKRNVEAGDDLFELSGGREVYDGYIISELYAKEGNEYVYFSNDKMVKKGQAIGGVDDDTYKRLQIRKTIEEHLNKELRLRPKGLKVLSLFFIDRVANYREYDDDLNPRNGKYADMFEEEYAKLIRKPKYNELFDGVDKESSIEKVHDGYFSIDSKGRGSNKKEFYTDTSGKTKGDIDTYSLIMKDKEELLSLDNRLKFIFSHSALKEGWDNPNVFQICTLNETNSMIKKRQEIGRGLRIAVNQDGERVHGFDVNTLTVMANESYEDFAKQLQKEIEQEEGITFNVVEPHTFANIPVQKEDGELGMLGVETSKIVWQHLRLHNYINGKGRVQDTLRMDLKHDVVNLPEEVVEQSSQIKAILKKISGKLNIKNADNKRTVKPKKEVLLSEDFEDLWNRIKYKTTYRVDFDSEKLIEACAKELRDKLRVGKARFKYQKAKTEIDHGGVQTNLTSEGEHTYDATDFALPDIISILQNETNLTRKTLAEILIQSGRLNAFTNNPQKFIEQALGFIKDKMRTMIVDGIKYHKIGDERYYAQELFESEELTGYLNENMMEAEKSVHSHVVYDSDVEENFAAKFEQNDAIKLYAKLPAWFTITTPLGPYNPDWAVLYEKDGEEKLYFVVETKGSLFSGDLREKEQGKIECGREHFKALDSGVIYEPVNNFDSFLDVVDDIK